MLKKFISYYKPNIKLFILDITCAFLIAAIDLVFPSIMRLELNDVIPSGKIQTLYIF